MESRLSYYRDRVITVHGINSRGEWQDELSPILTPFFEPIPIKYEDYRFRGDIKLFFGPFTLTVLLGSILMYLIVYLSFRVFSPTHLLFLLLLLVVAYGEAHYRRYKLVQRFKEEVTRKTGKGRPPHVIAHSLGSYLIGSTLERYPDVQFKHVILTGCVLPSDFDWHALYLNYDNFTSVRNEVGERDRVSWFAGVLRRALRGLGNAGYRGFRDSNTFSHRGRILDIAQTKPFVHSMSNPYGPCGICRADGSSARVHNVIINKFNHSDPFVGDGHASKFWIPYLWGYQPKEYWDLIELCRNAAAAAGLSLRRQLAIIENEIGDHYCHWVKKTLRDYLRECIEGRIDSDDYAGENLDNLVRRAIGLIWRSIEDAEKHGASNQPLAMNPHIGISRAVDAIVGAQEIYDSSRKNSAP